MTARSGALLARAFPVPLPLAAVLVALLCSQGGYFSPSWGWSSVVVLVAIGAWAIVARTVELGRAEGWWLAAIAALVAWTGLSALWSPDVGSSVLAAERALLYLVAVAAVLALSRSVDTTALLAAVLAAIVVVSAYALSTRLFPGHFGIVDTTAGYRLATPIGYWNGLGILAAMGVLVALAILVDSYGVVVRVLAASSTVVLVLTIYYTFSRASWVALVFGYAVILCLTRRRLRLVARTAAAAAAPGLALLSAVRQHALNEYSSSVGLHTASREGRHLFAVAVVACIVGAALMLAEAALERRFVLSARAHRAAGAGLVAVLVLAVAGGFVVAGKTPGQLVSRAYSGFKVATPNEGQDLNKRLLSFSSNGRLDLWRVAWHEYLDHPLLGSGAGTYERHWLANPKADFYVRNAHGLYIETLAELGPLGLILVLTVLLAPLVVAVRSRRDSPVVAAAGAYAAFVLHAGVDWDWQLGAVTLTALTLGAVLVVGARRSDRAPAVLGSRARALILAGVIGLSVVAGGTYLANAASANADKDLVAGRFAAAALAAERAHRLEPWSALPNIELAEANLGSGDFATARTDVERAIRQDPGNWESWLDLGLATRGRTRARALARAKALYPTSAEVAEAIATNGSAAASVESRSSRRNGVSGGTPAPK